MRSTATDRFDASLHMSTSRLIEVREQLMRWLLGDACPLWSSLGIDANGGFVECLSAYGRPHPVERRARVAPRQMFSFAIAAQLGWQGPAAHTIDCGYRAFQRLFRRSDGLYRTRVDADGVPSDDRALLYDQAFVLLALSTQPSDEMRREAVRLREAIAATYRTAAGAFRSEQFALDKYEANPHMHLLEACLAWTAVDADPVWRGWADDITKLALEHFIGAETGALIEAFTPDFQPAPDIAGRLVEPGHQFEWAWLLMRSAPQARPAALRLIEVGERHGVRQNFAINALLDDFSIHDGNARLWPQTERLKAALLAAELTDEARYLAYAADAATTLVRYLDTRVAGLWLDQRLADGTWPIEPSPASSFYHIVSAVHALARWINHK
jgi:mannose/cellobiose epimerase-like protein (N-acyl-D-glucosamine 2-epimerase family)